MKRITDKERLDWISIQRRVSFNGRYCWQFCGDFHRPINRSLRQYIDADIRASRKRKEKKRC